VTPPSFRDPEEPSAPEPAAPERARSGGGERVTMPASGRIRGRDTGLFASPPLAVGLVLGLELGIARLRRRSTVISLGLGLALVVAAAMIERKLASAGATDRALRAAFGLVIPLLAFSLLVAVTGRAHLADACWSAARFGVPRRTVASGLIGAVVAAAAVGSALVAATAVLVAHGAGGGALVADAFTSAWIGALTGAAYVGWFALGATFFARGGGRFVPLVLDFLVGGGSGITSAVFPRANAENLLGGQPPLDLSQPASSLLLLAMALLLSLAAAARCRE
jgi:hypothetical protein